VISFRILTDAMMIKRRIEFTVLFLILLPLGFGAAETDALRLCVTGCLFARNPFFVALQIDDFTHQPVRVLDGAVAEQGIQ
jgi:hypothetical protein